MNDNTDNEREELESKFEASLDDKAKAIINIVNEINRLYIQSKICKDKGTISCAFDIYKSVYYDKCRSWLYIIFIDSFTDKVINFDIEITDSVDKVNEVYIAFCDICIHNKYNVRTWEQIQSNTDFIQYIC